MLYFYYIKNKDKKNMNWEKKNIEDVKRRERERKKSLISSYNALVSSFSKVSKQSTYRTLNILTKQIKEYNKDVLGDFEKKVSFSLMKVVEYHLNNDATINIFNAIKEDLQDAKERGLIKLKKGGKLSDIEQKMPKLLEKVVTYHLSEENTRIQDYKEILNTFNIEKENGSDVKEIERLIPTVLERVIEVCLIKIEKTPEIWLFKELREFLTIAKKEKVNLILKDGEKLSDIEQKMPKLLEEVVKYHSTQNNNTIDFYNDVKITLDQEKETELDVSKVEKLMPELLKTVLENYLTEIKKNSAFWYFNKLNEALNIAKKEKVDITLKDGKKLSDIEKEIPELWREFTIKEINNNHKYSFSLVDSLNENKVEFTPEIVDLIIKNHIELGEENGCTFNLLYHFADIGVQLTQENIKTLINNNNNNSFSLVDSLNENKVEFTPEIVDLIIENHIKLGEEKGGSVLSLKNSFNRNNIQLTKKNIKTWNLK